MVNGAAALVSAMAGVPLRNARSLSTPATKKVRDHSSREFTPSKFSPCAIPCNGAFSLHASMPPSSFPAAYATANNSAPISSFLRKPSAGMSPKKRESTGLAFLSNTHACTKRRERFCRASLSAEAETLDASRQTETKDERRQRIENTLYDAVVVGAGIGGIVTASQLARKGAKVLLLEKYIIPGGSSGAYQREGYTFDVGSSVMFGLGAEGNVNLITRALSTVDRKLDLIEDPTAVHYHMPNGLSVKVHRKYEQFLEELISNFPHEDEGIRKFYDECWIVFNALNALELKSLEEPLYLLGQFFKNPLACLTLAYYLPQNAGDIAKKYIKDPNVLSFIDAECFIVSTVNSCYTPMINAAMVLCDRHYGGINYPVGGVGKLSEELIIGLENYGGEILYRANVTNIIMKDGKATGVELSNGMVINAKNIISNATRWDTFDKLIPANLVPDEEKEFKKKYKKSPSFLSIHLGVDEKVIPKDTECHHLILETEWSRMELPYETIFLSMPTILDPSLAPPQRHILHIFTTSFIDDFEDLPRSEYVKKKELLADKIIERLEKTLFPGLTSAITFREVGTPKTHHRFLARDDGTYGPIPSKKPLGLLAMPFNTTEIDNLYCVGDSCFPGQGVIAVAFSGIMCAHRIAANLGIENRSPTLDAGLNKLLKWFRSLA